MLTLAASCNSNLYFRYTHREQQQQQSRGSLIVAMEDITTSDVVDLGGGDSSLQVDISDALSEKDTVMWVGGMRASLVWDEAT